jgi:hypothetical protein
MLALNVTLHGSTASIMRQLTLLDHIQQLVHNILTRRQENEALESLMFQIGELVWAIDEFDAIGTISPPPSALEVHLELTKQDLNKIHGFTFTEPSTVQSPLRRRSFLSQFMETKLITLINGVNSITVYQMLEHVREIAWAFKEYNLA